MAGAPVGVSGGRRPPGEVRRALVAAGLDLAGSGGPDAVVLREATRAVGVVPNAAYRHFADRNALLNAVCKAAMGRLAARMEEALARVGAGGTKGGATARLDAVGSAYLDFAMTETGLFETAFAVPRHLEYAADADAAGPGGRTAFQILDDVLDELVATGAMPASRRIDAEYPVWACVHGMATLLTTGPLRDLPSTDKGRLGRVTLQFIARGI